MQSRLLSGLLGIAMAMTAMMRPAMAADYLLTPSERDQVLAMASTDVRTAKAAAPILLGATPLSVAASASPELDWSDLALPPDPDAQKKLEAGHMRENMSLAHMLLGGATLGLLTVAGVSGVMLVGQNDPNVRLVHQAAVTSGTLAYLADGSLMLFAPRPYKTKGEAHVSNIDYHRYLFYLHLAGMTSAVLTGLVATRFWGLDPSLDIRRTHPAIGATAIGLIGVSATVMALNF